MAYLSLVGMVGAAQGASLTVMSPAQFVVSAPLLNGKDHDDRGQQNVHRHQPSPKPKSGNTNAFAQDGALQTSAGPLIPATAGTHFDGLGANGSAPPDTNMALGANPAYNYILQTVNSRYAIYTKTGALVVGPNSLSSLWAPLGTGNGCATNNGGDVVAQYDKLADRWIITQLGGLSAPFSECIAISTSADPAGTYYLYSYPYGTTMNDYPKFGVWPTTTNSAYLASYNLFGNGTNFIGGQLCAYDRAKMLAGDPTAQGICYTINSDGGYLPSDLDGSAPPLDGTPGYFLNFETLNSLRMYSLQPNFANPPGSILTQITPDVGVTAFSEACGGGVCVPQSGTSQQLDSLGDRLMYRLAFRNFGDHEALVVNHSVANGTSVGVRWYELRSPVAVAAAFSLYQQSTYAPDSTYRWMGSAAMDGSGNLAVGYSASSGSLFPAIRYAARAATDVLNTLGAESSIIEGSGSQTSLDRWGDYSAMRIDPTDDCTFWYTNQYEKTTGSFNWSTHIGSFKFTSCRVGAPIFSPGAGTYSSAQSVSLSSTTAGASIRYTTDGSTTPSETIGTLYNNTPIAVASNTTIKAIAYENGMTDSAVTSAVYIITGGTSNTAAFVKTDTTTQGSWKGVYGANGYNVIDDTVSYPSYVTVTPVGNSNYIWTASTSDVRAMQKASSSTDRIAATWYTSGSFSIDLSFNDAAQHQVAVYCVDWDGGGARSQSLSILDGSTNTVLDSRNATTFQNGQYVVWKVSGHVILRVTKTGGPNAVVSGLFFDAPAGSPVVAAPTFSPGAGTYSSAQSVSLSSTTAGASIRYTTDGSTTPSETIGTLYIINTPIAVASNTTIKAIAYENGMTDSAVTSAVYIITGGTSNTAAFVKTDTTTQGSWKGVYGANGYNVIDDTVSYPSYVTVTPVGNSNYIWTASTSDVRAMQKASSSTDRIAATWYTSGSFSIDLSFNDAAQHQVAVYCVDWDGGGARSQSLSILDGSTNTVLDSRNATTFQNGQYVVWKVSGHVILRVTKTGGPNAVVSGLFFDAPAGSPVVAAPTFSPGAGTYSSAQSVSLSSTTAGASIRYTTDGSTTPSETIGTLYIINTPIAVASNTTIKAIAYENGMTDSAVTSAVYIITGGTSNTAAFVKSDTTTQGSWKGVYGANGYNVIDDTVSYPSYVTVTPVGNSNYIWTASTSDVRAMQKASSSTDRIAATWYTSGSFSIDLSFNDAAQHQVAVYCVDWDGGGARSQSLSILDGSTNTVLDSRNATTFQNGQYVVWKVSGHVILRVTKTGGPNAVVSGLFFD